MGLGELLTRQNPLLNIPRKQQGDQVQPTSAVSGFVAQYLKCLGINDLAKVPGVLREARISEDAVKCISNLMKSASWEELFTKLNMEMALFEAVSRKEIQQLMDSGNSTSGAPLALYAAYSSILSISIIRQLLNNESTREMGLMKLAEVTYVLFDLLMELAKRKVIPPNLEVEFWRAREALVATMEELFKRNRMVTVNDKSFDGNKQLR
jgi:hypothetical protein